MLRREYTFNIDALFKQNIQDVRTVFNLIAVFILTKRNKIIYCICIDFDSILIIDLITDYSSLIGEQRHSFSFKQRQIFIKTFITQYK